jgi:hypothetical protein
MIKEHKLNYMGHKIMKEHVLEKGKEMKEKYT